MSSKTEKPRALTAIEIYEPESWCKDEVISVPFLEHNMVAYLRPMMLGDQDWLDVNAVDPQTRKPDAQRMLNYRARILVCCLCTEDGKLLFPQRDDSAIVQVSKLRRDIGETLYDEAVRISRLKDEAVKIQDEAKNS